MNILAIESSCDDTSVAYLQGSTQEPIFIVDHKTISQIDVHKAFGGIVPEIAGRKHAEAIVPLIASVLNNNPTPDAIAVTSGPGLITGLLVGIEVAKSLSYAKNIPLIPINHIEGHIHSVFVSQKNNPPIISQLKFPALCLVVSGGHTEIILMRSLGKYERIGKTKDDASGEAFDKIAKMLDLSYPGGPKISKLAIDGDPRAIPFPRPMLNSPGFDFSFSGLKTAVLYYLQDHPNTNHADVAASAQEAIVEVLTKKLGKAVDKYQPKSIILAGGVSANTALRNSIQTLNKDLNVYTPETSFCMDNAAMIGAAAFYHAEQKNTLHWREVVANPNWRIDEM